MKLSSLPNLILKQISAVTLLAVIGVSSPSLHAATYGVRVVDFDGVPIAGAAVCVGIQGNYKQFGALFTDATGTAQVDVPNVPLIVTVSKNRTAGIRITEPARGFNLIKQVKLIDGIPGPRCRADSSLADAPGIEQIRIADIDIREDAFSMTLRPNVSGDPSHYRVSDKADFTDAKWRRFSTTIPLTEYSDAEMVFVQMRRLEGTAKSWLESRSDVVTVRLNPQL
jgi:ribosomal protein L11